MAIKNYTTKVSTFQTLGEIQGTLAEHGARKVMIDYDNSGNATMDEIFLPYLIGNNNKTLYECFSSGQIALPSADGWEV